MLPACSSPTREISYRECSLGKHRECSLGKHRECSLGKHFECSLGKHQIDILAAQRALPWEARRVLPAFSIPPEKFPIYRKRAWLVSKRQWSGRLRHVPANARAWHKSRQPQGDWRTISWPRRFTRHPSPQARFLPVPHSWRQDLSGGVYSYLRLQRCPLLHAVSSKLCP